MDSLGLRRNSRTGMVVPVMRLSITGLLKLGMGTSGTRFGSSGTIRVYMQPDRVKASRTTKRLRGHGRSGLITCFENFRWRPMSVIGILRQLTRRTYHPLQNRDDRNGHIYGTL